MDSLCHCGCYWSAGYLGNLSLSRDSPANVMDYDDGLPRESVVLNYHTSRLTSDEERRRAFPADPNIGRTNMTSSVATSRRARRVRFCGDLLELDDSRCVLSDIDEMSCNAVHLVAHSKGDAVCYLYLSPSLSPWKRRQYILNYTQHRSREPDRNNQTTFCQTLTAFCWMCNLIMNSKVTEEKPSH